MKTIALLGAGGKMGLRLSANLKDSPYRVRHVEISERGRAALAERGFQAVPLDEALDGVDVVIMGVPDNRIGQVAHEIAPKLKSGTMLVMLDAAAPYAGDLPDRADLVYFVTHPCHPPIFNDETDLEAKRDYFGGIKAKQHIVCALMQGPEESYALGEDIARTIYAPVMKAHRVTVEQMAMLEPVLSETVGATLCMVLREAVDEAVRRGVPYEAARDFMFGHLTIELAIAFEQLPGGKFSDGALKAIEAGKKRLFRPDWKGVFDKAEMDASIRAITGSETPASAG